MPLKPACRRPISEPSSTGTETSRSPWLTPSIARRSWRTGRATAWVASLVATKPAPIAAAAANQIGAIRSFGSVDVAADRDQRDHQDRHAGAQHPREQQPRGDAERARLGRRRAVEREREGRAQLPLAGEVDRGAGGDAGERDRDRLLERELARREQVREREQRHRDQPAHERHAREQDRQPHDLLALVRGRRAAFGEPAPHPLEPRLGVAVEGQAGDQRVDGGGQQRDAARHDGLLRGGREDDGHVDREHRHGQRVDDAARQRRAPLELQREGKPGVAADHAVDDARPGRPWHRFCVRCVTRRASRAGARPRRRRRRASVSTSRSASSGGSYWRVDAGEAGELAGARRA